MSPRWLGSLVRARKIQQDTAQRDLAEAERLVRAAHTRARQEADRLDTMIASVDEVDGPAFVAAAVALQAAAATHAAARQAAVGAERTADDRRSALRAASVAANSADELQERIQLSERAAAARLGQRDLDEVAAGIHRRQDEDQR